MAVTKRAVRAPKPTAEPSQGLNLAELSPAQIQALQAILGGGGAAPAEVKASPIRKVEAISRTMSWDKTTSKGTLRFAEEQENGPTQFVYLSESEGKALGVGEGDTVTVSITR